MGVGDFLVRILFLHSGNEVICGFAVDSEGKVDVWLGFGFFCEEEFLAVGDQGTGRL